VAAFSTATKTATETILLTLLRQLKRFRHFIHADKVFGTHNGIEVAQTVESVFVALAVMGDASQIENFIKLARGAACRVGVVGALISIGPLAGPH
jgi:hypothetical protein